LLEEATDSNVDNGASHGARESGGELLAPTATHATESATGGQGDSSAQTREMCAAAPHAFSDTSGSESESDTESTSGDELPLPPLHLHLAPTAK